MSDTLLEIKDLNIVYKTDEETVHAVNGIRLRVGTKETLGLVGETGAGKTTTALAIMRLLPDRIGKVEGGEILFDGKNLLELKENEMRGIRGQEIAMIFQDPMTSLNPVLTVEDQILEVLKIHNHSNQSNEELGKRVEEMLELVGIPAVRKSCYPHEFSGGMKQRVVIAMALACNPRLLIAADRPDAAEYGSRRGGYSGIRSGRSKGPSGGGWLSRRFLYDDLCKRGLHEEDRQHHSEPVEGDWRGR